MRLSALRLRSQLVIAAACLALYTIAVATAFQNLNRAEEALEMAFHQDRIVLTRLPRLGDDLRHVELLTNQYLLTGEPAWLYERRRLIGEIGNTEDELDVLISGQGERGLWTDLKGRLSAYLARQERWIGRKQQGRMSLPSAVRMQRQTASFDKVLAVIVKMRDENFEKLQERRRGARSAARAAFYATIAAGFAIAFLLLFFVSWYVVGPITALEAYARNWQLGQEWRLRTPSTGPELDSLFSSMRQMSRRLNERFVRERELAQFKTQLVSLVSHEFNNALSVINGASLLLEDSEDAKNPAKRRSYYEMLKANIRALHVAANNLLNMGLLESGKFALNLKRARVRDILQQAAQRLDILALRKNIKVVLELPETPVEVRADPEALSLVATNLLGNAIKYTPDNGSVAVRVALDPADRGKLKISVCDTGIGIKAQDKERIFSGYFRTEQGKSAAKGFGVGLSLAKRVVEAHGSE
ncbi:MAG: hypothetical protein KGK30_04925, partial [Elusimicrobia bacterium]|nr:hypothetical protein [Elusimicrobiota bacterium]